MIDARLSIIAAVLREPNKPLKFFIETSEVSRATFFKAKTELAERGIVRLVGRKKLELNTEEAREFVSSVYPGLVDVFFGSVERKDQPHSARDIGLYAETSAFPGQPQA